MDHPRAFDLDRNGLGAILLAIAFPEDGTNGLRQASNIATMVKVFPALADRYALNTLCRLPHFIAQICCLSDGLVKTAELGGGHLHEWRRDLGNAKRGDGARFKGRGFIPILGRHAYANYGRSLGLDLVADPDLVERPDVALLIACEFWRTNSINQACDRDDLQTIAAMLPRHPSTVQVRRGFLNRSRKALAPLAIAHEIADHNSRYEQADFQLG